MSASEPFLRLHSSLFSTSWSLPFHVFMSSLLARLFCCCLVRPRRPVLDVESAVIPNETSRLIEPPSSARKLTGDSSPATVVDHQTLSDRLGTIVRAKEGKMVNVSARTPFTLHSTASPTSEAENSDTHADGGTAAGDARPPLGRLPPILTMTPARTYGNLNLYSESRHSSDGHSSPVGSRSSSHIRPDQRSRSTNSHSHSHSSNSATDGRGLAVHGSEWFMESSSEYSVEEEAEPPSPSPIPIANQQTPTAADPQAIAFSWGDV
ncbi:hypothetical protein B0H11DRAFT_2421420 [Mycena galericulata]|nr:hypothetical protein B0H11DRAFT_2421420 [Mycena galericulata]